MILLRIEEDEGPALPLSLFTTTVLQPARETHLRLGSYTFLKRCEDYEGGFEVATMVGAPHEVSMTGSDTESAEDALNHLLDGLRAFGLLGVLL